MLACVAARMRGRYAKTFWMRGTGGATGLVHYRWGGVDNKADLARRLLRYEDRHQCRPFQVAVGVPLSVCVCMVRSPVHAHARTHARAHARTQATTE